MWIEINETMLQTKQSEWERATERTNEQMNGIKEWTTGDDDGGDCGGGGGNACACASGGGIPWFWAVSENTIAWPLHKFHL